tara:strand:+ start:542 stop:1441 length:900 start_codon:yes stop_codon:yes gene_type:complete
MRKESKFQSELIILTGANGFTGRYVCKELKRKNINFIALIRPNTDTKWLDENLIKYRFADIYKYQDLVEAMDSCNILINIASIGFGAAPILLSACKKVGIDRALFVSTTAIFTKLNSASKSIRLEAEKQITESRLNYTIIRPTMIFGSKDDRNIFRLIKWIRKYPFIPVFQKGEGLQRPVFVEDVAWAIVESINNSKTHNKSFNIAGPKAIKFNQMIDIISKKLGKRIIKISINAYLAILFIKFMNLLNIKILISEEQVKRVIEDKNFSNKKAKELINFNPKSFDFVIGKEIDKYFKNY